MQGAPASTLARPAAEAGEAVTGVKTTPAQAPEVSASTEAGGASAGLPQFRTEHWPAQALWLVILFAVLYALMSRVFAPRLRRVRDEREAAITGALDDGRRVRAEAEAQGRAAEAELAEARARSQKTAADAKARAQADAAARQSALEAELNGRLEVAEARIRESRTAAMTQVRGVAAETAGVIAERLTGRAPAPGEVDAALDAVAARA